MTVRELIEFLKTHDPNMPVAFSLWQPDDVRWHAEENDIELSEDEIANVLGIMHHKQDASLGLSWTTLECAVERVLEDKEQEDETCCDSVLQ